MSVSRTLVLAKGSVRWSIALCALMLAAGLLAFVVPLVSGMAATGLMGRLLIISGLLHFMFSRFARGGFAWELLLGIVYGAAGVYLLLHPAAGLTVLKVGLAVYLAFEAGLEFVQCWQLRQLQGVGWIFFDAILTLVIAIVVWVALPLGSSLAIGALIGISMSFSGISRLMLVLAGHK